MKYLTQMQDWDCGAVAYTNLVQAYKWCSLTMSELGNIRDEAIHQCDITEDGVAEDDFLDYLSESFRFIIRDLNESDSITNIKKDLERSCCGACILDFLDADVNGDPHYAMIRLSEGKVIGHNIVWDDTKNRFKPKSTLTGKMLKSILARDYDSSVIIPTKGY